MSESTAEPAAPLGAEHEPPATAGALIKRAPLPQSVGKFVLGDDEIRRAWRVSSALAASGMYPDAAKAEIAFAKVLVGRDLGISPSMALGGIDIVKGHIFMRGVLLLSFIRKLPHYDYRIVSLAGPEAEADERKQHATLRFFAIHPDGTREALIPDITYTTEMAKTAGLLRSGSAWMSARRNMLLWRAASDGVKFHCPDALGGIPVYTEADEFREAPALGDGTGSGEAAGIALGPEVEAVLARAVELGHAGLADRGTVELVLGDQPPAKVAEWVRAANRELDAIPVDAEVVEAQEGAVSPNVPREAQPIPEPVEAFVAARAATQTAETPMAENVVADPARIDALRRRANDLLDMALEAEVHGDPRAAEYRDEAEGAIAEVEALTDPAQTGMDF